MTKLFQNLSLIALVPALTLLTLNIVHAGDLDVPVMEHADGNLDTCALGQVAGLKKIAGNSLSVRSGPAVKYMKIDELHNGEKVWLFDRQGKWIGIVYAVDELSCSPILKDRIVPHKGKKGWVHENWIEVLAG